MNIDIVNFYKEFKKLLEKYNVTELEIQDECHEPFICLGETQYDFISPFNKVKFDEYLQDIKLKLVMSILNHNNELLDNFLENNN